MTRYLKHILGIALVAIVVTVALIFLTRAALTDSLPKYVGEEIVEGLRDRVDIYRDSAAVPYIVAQNEYDAAFSLGYVHAQERMFQMDISRRAAQGRLSEIFGSKTVEFDKMFRTLGFGKLAAKEINMIDEETYNYLKAYSAGVNLFLKENKGHCGIEFDILGYEPCYWKPEDCILFSKLMAWQLNISWWTDITFAHLVQKFGEEKAAELFPNYKENAPTIIPDRLAEQGRIVPSFVALDKRFREFFGSTGTHIGSNNWVVNANMSSSGKPIIANDPHLTHTLPGIWYLASVRSDKWRADGFTIPGVPGIVIGKNENISWAFTNVMADDCDYYFEQIDSTQTRYLLDGKYKNLEFIEDTIKVKDSSSVVFQIRKTHRGPIVSDIHTYNILFPQDEKKPADISMRWTAFDFSNQIKAILDLNKANNWKEFLEAVKGYEVPGQNFIYADKNNNIGYICAAKLPIRKNQSSSLIFDGTASENDWRGYVPFEMMPKLYNPDQNYLASANNKTVKSFGYHISNLWEPDSRIRRINELLLSRNKHSVSDFRDYQNDIVSKYAMDIIPHIALAFENIEINDNNLKSAIELLKNWNCEMDYGLQAPTIYQVFLQKLIENIFLDEMGKELFNEYVFVANVPYKKIEEILNGNSISWIDDVRTDKRESLKMILRKSLADALYYLEANFGKDITDWQWGKLHKVTLRHLFGQENGFVGNIFNIGSFEVSGDGTTLFNSEYSFTKPYDNNLGQSMRFIFDFANPNELLYSMPSGQSGHFMSEYYSDMTSKWISKGYNKLNVNPNSEDLKEYKLLSLYPKR